MAEMNGGRVPGAARPTMGAAMGAAAAEPWNCAEP